MLLAGLYLPDAGAIAVNGTPIAIGTPSLSVRNGIGMVHQQFKLVETLTGLENVSLAVDRAGSCSGARSERRLPH